MNSLAKRSAHAAMWNYAGNGIRVLLQFGIGVLLARLLGPAAFGIVAIALLLIGLGQLFVDFGFSAVIIQTRELRPSDIDFLFTAQVVLGATMTLAGMALAGPLAAFFNEPKSVEVIRWMSLMFIMRAAGQTAIAQLSRDLKFREIQAVTIASYLIGYVAIGVPLAYSGHGVWSLVAAQLVQTGTSALIGIALVRSIPRLTLRGGRADLIRFGWQVIAGNFGSWTLNTLDWVIVGRIAGAVPLGLYGRAQNLASAPSLAVVTALQGVLFAASSRAQGNPVSIKRGVLACVTLFLLLAGAVLIAIAATGETVLLAVYGADWAGAVPLITPLALAMVVHGTLAFFGPALMGIGQVAKDTAAQWLTIVVMVPLVLVAASVSVEAVAWAVLVTYLLRLLLLARALHGVVHFGLREVTNALLPAFLVALASAAAAALADYGFAAWSPAWRLLPLGAAAGVGYLACAFALRRHLLNGPVGSIVLQAGIVPAPILRRLVPDA